MRLLLTYLRQEEVSCPFHPGQAGFLVCQICGHRKHTHTHNSFLLSPQHRREETKHQLQPQDSTQDSQLLWTQVFTWRLEVKGHSFPRGNVNLAGEDRWFERRARAAITVGPGAEALHHTQTDQRPFTPGWKHSAVSWDIRPKRLT